MSRTIVAIDGPAGSGKSTVARRVASQLGLTYLDTGATYRLVALRALQKGVPLDDAGALAELAAETMRDCRIEGGDTLCYDGHAVGREIRTPEVSEATSIISMHAEVRRVLVEFQRGLVPNDGAVVEGRDIGTVVWPDADLKLYLDARADVRAERRVAEQGTSDAVTVEVHERDQRDATRPVSAMQPAPDAHRIDTTELGPDDVVAHAISLLSPPRPPRPRTDRLYKIFRGILAALLFGPFRLTIRGRDNIPATGAAILAFNHRSLIDIPVAGVVSKRKVWFMAKEELFRSRLGGAFISRFGAFRVRRGRPDRKALQRALDLLAAGEVVGIFPEGTRTPGARYQELEEGFAYIALKSGAPIVPAAISGTEAVFPPGKKFPRFVRIDVAVGPPFTLGTGAHQGILPRRQIRAATEEARTRLVALMEELEPAGPGP